MWVLGGNLAAAAALVANAIDDVLCEQGSVASCKTTYAKSYRHGGVW